MEMNGQRPRCAFLHGNPVAEIGEYWIIGLIHREIIPDNYAMSRNELIATSQPQAKYWERPAAKAFYKASLTLKEKAIILAKR